ncbi:ATP-binding cassette domain-containing protein [Cutibacterium sp.]|uniref:ATP-binding cassette domain-containing protein n=1 Tax=Cutibacterium sp. TaxID=1912221 RepID=UPI0026DCB55C|nr:ATP-binding cassette domain-containing protein [Cutibacterium sp.]MDO4412549.1 ATP-binding cassette domain-containing protein [Cutibacterium sp.]
MSLLEIKDLTIRYGKKLAVDHVSWSIGPGFHALLGPNGAGKTSLMSSIATLLRPTSGSITIDGREGKDIRKSLGYCPQDNLRKSSFTVAQHLEYMCWLRCLPSDRVASEVSRILSLTSLADCSGQKIKTLSGGTRRRVAIGSALIGQPSLVILDEPSAGLDIGQRDSLSTILSSVAEQAITIVSTHLVEDIIDHASTITVMNNGRFCFDGRFEDFSTSRNLDDVRDSYLEIVS